MDTTTLTIPTGARSTTVDMTKDVAEFCAGKGDGLVSVFIPHATAGVAILETGAGSDTDLLGALYVLFPPDQQRWRHEH